jgi:hypothetical protein
LGAISDLGTSESRQVTFFIGLFRVIL